MTKPRQTRPNHMTPDERAECVALYRAGETRNALAERYDRDVKTIDRLITRKGAQRRRNTLTIDKNVVG